MSNLSQLQQLALDALAPLWTASSFRTGGAPGDLYILDAVSVPMALQPGSTVPLYLATDSGTNTPGALLLGLAMLPIDPNASVQIVPAPPLLFLAPATRYWLVAGNGIGDVSWPATFSTAESSATGWTIGDDAFRRIGLGGWSPTSSGQPNETALLAVDATALATVVHNVMESQDLGLAASPLPAGSAVASSFTTGPTVSSPVEVLVLVQTNDPGGIVELRLRADLGNAPGALLASLGTANLSPGRNARTFPVSFPLAPSTQYWITMGVGAGGSVSVTWESTFSPAQVSPSGWTIGDQAFQTTNGTTWTPINAGPATETGRFALVQVSVTGVPALHGLAAGLLGTLLCAAAALAARRPSIRVDR